METRIKARFIAVILLACVTRPPSQPIDIRGVLKTPSGEPVPGAVVALKNKKLSDTTKADGAFHISNMDPNKPMSPLRKLAFSQQTGFAFQMGSPEEVIAEIMNGAGRVVMRGQYNLDSGGWVLRPKNLAPGLYTVHLWTGSQLRALRLPIEESPRGGGRPEWQLDKIPDGDTLSWGSWAVDSVRAEKDGYLPTVTPIFSWTQLRVKVEAKKRDAQ